ncbi:winged helix-turn-helix domain-containing protein [Sphingomonas glaciei]|uniref:Transcriptional regulator n=1 Tax=Sphingomonas glaciei TaxID=2938948 RepID=A0ABY5MXA8_9SPHN|nr:transcriptional regulator [Sphingomonas glaciei]UUR09080.1 transcriptional regulator [Sphingomonas glaciei]
MSNEVLEFEGFTLEPAERRLTRDGAPVEISGRYLDALLLLAGRPGELITKDRFMGEVWRGVPVTDEALTQCIRNLRKALGDQAGRPRFIETVPRHGYRFVAEVRVRGAASEADAIGDAAWQSGPAMRAEATVAGFTSAASPDGEIPVLHGAAPIPNTRTDRPNNLKPDSSFKSQSARSQFLLIAAAGLVGGAGSGLVGGIGYGLIAATEPPAGTGAISILLVMTCLCVLIGLIGGLGVGGGSALGRLVARGRLFPLMAGGAFGGLAVGALGRLIGLDAFSLLIGSRPLAITGGSEGLIIGAIAGAALWLAERDGDTPPATTAGKGALLGAIAGLLMTLGGGKMMAGSLAGLAAVHPDAPLGRLLTELTPPLLLAAGAAEGAIFIAALTLSYALVLRSRSAPGL